MGLTWCLIGKESDCQCRRLGFDPWIRKIPWRRKCQPNPGFLPRKSHGQRSLEGYSPWGCKVNMCFQIFLIIGKKQYYHRYVCIPQLKFWELTGATFASMVLRFILQNSPYDDWDPSWLMTLLSISFLYC